MSSNVVLSGMRSTGDLHIGHYFGAIQNWLALQDQHQCYFFAADWHALTTDYEDPSRISEMRRENLIDWMACGLDPDRCTFFIQSKIPQIAELQLLFSMITPLGWLERNPTYKDQQNQLQGVSSKDTSCLGFFSYPILQAADIAIVRGQIVPVGEDQLPHLELNREIVRRFHHLYGKKLKKPLFPEPKPLLTPTPKLLGLDQRKMSKSYGNAIGLRDDQKTVEKKIKSMVTDPAKVRLGDPGHPEVCNVFAYQKLFSALAENQSGPASNLKPEEIDQECRKGSLGCGTCKMNLAQKVNAFLDPQRDRRTGLTRDRKTVDDRIAEGCQKVRSQAEGILEEVRSAMGL